MSKIILEREKCIGCGSCAVLCPKYFELINDGKSHIIGADKKPASPPASPNPLRREASRGESQGGEMEELEVEKIECANSAVEACPVQCIYVKN